MNSVTFPNSAKPTMRAVIYFFVCVIVIESTSLCRCHTVEFIAIHKQNSFVYLAIVFPQKLVAVGAVWSWGLYGLAVHT